jgi:hypothetical protein
MALQIAGVRANETQLPENEGVFENPYAHYFFPEEVREQFKDAASAKAKRDNSEQLILSMNGAIVARIRFIDECLAKGLLEGLKQMVIIGAGYDTRAYRIKGSFFLSFNTSPIRIPPRAINSRINRSRALAVRQIISSITSFSMISHFIVTLCLNSFRIIGTSQGLIAFG